MNNENRKVFLHENNTPIQERYWVQERLPIVEQLIHKSSRSRNAVKKLLAAGRVSVDGHVVRKAKEIPETGALITVHRGAPPTPFVHSLLEVVWENHDYVVAYKKRGLPTVNTSHKAGEQTALRLLSCHYKKSDVDAKVFMINRLDRSTPGFIMFAKNIESKDRMVRSWSKCVKTQLYIACVEGEIESKEFILKTTSDNEKNKRPQITLAHVKVDKSSRLGRMHVVQADVEGSRIYSLRKVFGDNNFSIFGDVRSRSSFSTDKAIALEQISFEFLLPDTGQFMSFKRPYPTHFFQLLKEDK